MPSRRHLLRTAGIGLGLGLAGCLGTGGESPGGTTTGTSSTTAEPTVTTTEPPAKTSTTASPPPTVEDVSPAAVAERGVPVVPKIESSATRPFRAFSVGDREGIVNPENNLPHQVWVWNDTDAKRELTVALATGGNIVLDETVAFPARSALGIELAEPRPYELTVTAGDRERTSDHEQAGDREKTVEIPRSRFDCNHSVTDVAVQPEEIAEFTITTEMACSTTTASE